uniref:ABC transporter substrate-binding protein n=1 Tax=Desulfobacca acetoxidans TaxID=60893 RepID=A0A7C5ENZ5_9BACT
MKAWLWAVLWFFSLAAAGPAAERQVTDDRGRTLAVTSPPRRIVSLYGGLTEILVALGVASKLVARTQGDGAVPGIPAVGTHLQPNVEMIVALKPDLVVQGEVRKAFPALARLEQEGLKVALFAPRDFSGLLHTIQRLGTLTGREPEARKLVDRIEAQLAAVARKVAGRRPPRVFFEVRYHNLLAAGRGSIVHDIITKAGGVNVVEAPGKLVPLGLEALFQVDPEVYVIQKGPMNRSPEDIYSRPHFQELTAVKTRRVLVVEEDRFSRPGPRSAEAVEQLARFLHPEAWAENSP